MTVLVTGASGYAGEHVARWLQAQGREVAGTHGQREPAIAPSRGLDLATPGAAAALLEAVRPACVIHAAARTDVARCELDEAGARRDIVEATARLAEAVTGAARRPWWLYVSTDLVFDGEQAPYDVDALPSARSVYGRLKAEAERVALAAGACVARVPLLYGPRSRHKPGALFWMVDALARGDELRLFVDERRSPLHVLDLAWAADALARREASGVWNLGGPEDLDRATMGRIVAAALGLDAGRVRPVRREEVAYPAPRPRDVTLRSARCWEQLGGQPRGFARGVQDELACPQNPELRGA